MGGEVKAPEESGYVQYWLLALSGGVSGGKVEGRSLM
jgi:hypothetical protein